MRLIEMKLIVMTQPTFFVEEDKILTSLFDEGLDCLHLYKPDSSPMYAERLLTLLPDEYYSKIVVHDHFYLKEEYKLRGIHIDDASTPIPNSYKGKISCTCRKIENLKEAKHHMDYVFLKNIFDSQTFAEEKSSFTANELEEAAKLINQSEKPFIYLGGGAAISSPMCSFIFSAFSSRSQARILSRYRRKCASSSLRRARNGATTSSSCSGSRRRTR